MVVNDKRDTLRDYRWRPVRTVVTIIQDLGHSSLALPVRFHPHTQRRCVPTAQPLRDTLRSLCQTCVTTLKLWFLFLFLQCRTRYSSTRIDQSCTNFAFRKFRICPRLSCIRRIARAHTHAYCGLREQVIRFFIGNNLFFMNVNTRRYVEMKKLNENNRHIVPSCSKARRPVNGLTGGGTCMLGGPIGT